MGRNEVQKSRRIRQYFFPWIAKGGWDCEEYVLNATWRLAPNLSLERRGLLRHGLEAVKTIRNR